MYFVDVTLCDRFHSFPLTAWLSAGCFDLQMFPSTPWILPVNLKLTSSTISSSGSWIWKESPRKTRKKSTVSGRLVYRVKALCVVRRGTSVFIDGAAAVFEARDGGWFHWKTNSARLFRGGALCSVSGFHSGASVWVLCSLTDGPSPPLPRLWTELGSVASQKANSTEVATVEKKDECLSCYGAETSERK